MQKSIFFSLLASLFLGLGCDKQKDSPPQTGDFSCIKLFDEQGVGLGFHGGCTSSPDWGKITLKASEQTLLNFSDTVSLTGTMPTDITRVSAFPCPATIEGTMAFYFSGNTLDTPVKVKIVVIDESYNVVYQYAIRLNTGGGLAIQIDPSRFEAGKYYRMYYQISATGFPSLYEGYGNFLVCKTEMIGTPATIESDCF